MPTDAEIRKMLPSLPGFRDNSPRKRNKAQGFKFINGYALHAPMRAGPRAKPGAMPEIVDTKIAAPESGGLKAPWLVLDNKVLMFNAYFKEAVSESSLESFRVRSVRIMYYLADGSIGITEDKVSNSGMPAGVFIKRHLIPRERGVAGSGFLTVDDLKVGENITVYARTFHICGCNASTRAWLEKSGVAVAADESAPSDKYTKTREHVMMHESGKDPDLYRGIQMNEMKRWAQAALGKPREKNLKNFLANDRIVLRFHCSWRDTVSARETALHYYSVHFFVADNTIEILEEHQPNSGFERFPRLLNRTKVPRKGVDPPTDEEMYKDKGGDDSTFIMWSDFRVQDFVTIYNRKLRVHSCDSSTRAFYEAKGVPLAPDEPRDKDEPPAPPEVVPPPYTGFGSEEDSLGSCFSLSPKPPKKDYAKMLDNERNRLCFGAQMISRHADDKIRKFVVTYYLGDETVSVYEPPQRNTGIVGGRFKQRGKSKTADGSRYLNHLDFFVGQSLLLAGFNFKLVETDERTRTYMAANPAMFVKK
jgi:hypothetical protein